jgi:hypothetical protein
VRLDVSDKVQGELLGVDQGLGQAAAGRVDRVAAEEDGPPSPPAPAKSFMCGSAVYFLSGSPCKIYRVRQIEFNADG